MPVGLNQLMGNTQATNVLRAQLTQTQRQLKVLETKHQQLLGDNVQRQKDTETARQAAAPVKVTCARFAQTGATQGAPGSVQLTVPPNIKAPPLELAREAATRQLDLKAARVVRPPDQHTQAPRLYMIYRGLTQPSNQGQRPNFGAQRHSYDTQLIFVTRHDGAAPTPMTQDDVQWIGQHLASQQPARSGAVGMELRNQTAQRMGRPGMPMPFDDTAYNQDPHTLHRLMPRSGAGDAVQYRPPSSFAADQIHFQQVQNR